MTRPQPPDPHDRDPALDAAWSASSAELPPPHLDAAILAAAHREAQSRPHPAGDDDAVAHARGPARAMWGFAAAATIGAIAFGVLQLSPPLHTDSAPAVATDVPQSVAPSEAPAGSPRDAAPPMAEPRAGAPDAAENRATAKLREANRGVASSPPPAAPRAAPLSASRPALTEPSRPRERDSERAQDRQSSANAVTPAPARPPAATAPLAQFEATPPQPFPGVAPGPSVAGAASERAASPASPPPAAAKAEAGAGDGRREVQERASAAAPARSALQGSRRDQADTAAPLAKQATTPAAWVERIRRLHAERRFDDAARELKVFRDAYPDADARLPVELRAWAAGIERS